MEMIHEDFQKLALQIKDAREKGKDTTLRNQIRGITTTLDAHALHSGVSMDLTARIASFLLIGICDIPYPVNSKHTVFRKR